MTRDAGFSDEFMIECKRFPVFGGMAINAPVSGDRVRRGFPRDHPIVVTANTSYRSIIKITVQMAAFARHPCMLTSQRETSRIMVKLGKVISDTIGFLTEDTRAREDN